LNDFLKMRVRRPRTSALFVSPAQVREREKGGQTSLEERKGDKCSSFQKHVNT
jgi:hypothetical protein